MPIKEYPPSKADELLASIQRVLGTPDPDPCDGLLRDAIRLSLLVTDDMFEDDHTLDYLETLSDCWDGFIDRYLESVEGKELDARGVAKRILENIHDAIKSAEKAEQGSHRATGKGSGEPPSPFFLIGGLTSSAHRLHTRSAGNHSIYSSLATEPTHRRTGRGDVHATATRRNTHV
jgi:hypothetical protein